MYFKTHSVLADYVKCLTSAVVLLNKHSSLCFSLDLYAEITVYPKKLIKSLLLCRSYLFVSLFLKAEATGTIKSLQKSQSRVLLEFKGSRDFWIPEYFIFKMAKYNKLVHNILSAKSNLL